MLLVDNHPGSVKAGTQADGDDLLFEPQLAAPYFTPSFVPPGHQTLNVGIPWNDSRFQFAEKQHPLPAAGI
ncbi:MAG TPA: hypothetical protein VLH18_09060 [Candidatus Limnocylindrales bacterium]|nr:hypothetical protein [Candidatus Limnocylindrales bacterium]